MNRLEPFSYRQARQVVLQIIEHVLTAVNPATAVQRHLNIAGDTLFIGGEAVNHDLTNGRLFIVSVGKAALPMCQAAIEILGDKVYAGVGISKQPVSDWPNKYRKIKFYRGNHPVSGEESVLATTAVLDLLAQTREDDLVLCLISGGASALLTQPIIGLEDWQDLNQALLASGCTIGEFNTVRRQLDAVKGGGLAYFAEPANTESLILSDVVGSDLAAIGSGPTVKTDESPQDALAIIERYQIETVLETAVSQRIISTLLTADKVQPTCCHGHIIIGDVRLAVHVALQQAESLGFQGKLITTHLESEAREAGNFAVAIARDLQPGEFAVLGGETTVTLHGNGLGGRNLEVALGAAIALADRNEACENTAVATFATDGDDGPTGAAGAMVTGKTVDYGRELNLDARQYLDNNDSFTYFKTLDDAGYGPHLIITGPTGTNVNDLIYIFR